jgi:DNA repair exonuclease SbcCD ATPase subunit
MVAFIATIFLKYPDMGEKDLIAQLRARIAQLEKENKELRDKLAAAEAENKRINNLIVKLENDTQTAHTKFVTREKELKAQIEQITREFEEKARLIKQYEDRLRESEESANQTATEKGTHSPSLSLFTLSLSLLHTFESNHNQFKLSNSFSLCSHVLKKSEDYVNNTRKKLQT